MVKTESSPYCNDDGNNNDDDDLVNRNEYYS